MIVVSRAYANRNTCVMTDECFSVVFFLVVVFMLNVDKATFNLVVGWNDSRGIRQSKVNAT